MTINISTSDNPALNANGIKLDNLTQVELVSSESELKRISIPTSKSSKMPWRTLWIILIAAVVWLAMFAPTMQHNAQVSPVGARRSAALAALNPLAQLSRNLHLNYPVNQINSLIGRNGCALCSKALTVGPSGNAGHASKVKLGTSKLSSPYLWFGINSIKVSPNTGAAAMPLVPIPTSASPLRVLVVGDSLGVDLGDALANELSATGVVQTTVDAQPSTGLTRPDYFNWPARLNSDLSTYNPEVIVVMMGANDPQSYMGSGPDLQVGSPAWVQAYSQRVAAFMQEATSMGRYVMWVGQPPMQSPGLSSEMTMINEIDFTQALKIPHVTYIPSDGPLSGGQGGFVQYVSDAQGNQIQVRTPDGIHIAPGGADILGQAVEVEMQKILHITFG
ncbi:MAG: DUF459 domain-containing protein [Acidimicrobiales bacterium]|nr:DUF459 domain-containing protein [Acidimicrobiales bacterium]